MDDSEDENQLTQIFKKTLPTKYLKQVVRKKRGSTSLFFNYDDSGKIKQIWANAKNPVINQKIVKIFRKELSDTLITEINGENLYANCFKNH